MYNPSSVRVLIPPRTRIIPACSVAFAWLGIGRLVRRQLSAVGQCAGSLGGSAEGHA